VQLTGAGVRAELPAGWEGSVRAAPLRDRDLDDLDGLDGLDGPGAASPDAALRSAAVDADAAVLHVGTFALPADRGDFGSGAVEVMRDGDTFVALLEFGPEEVGTPLFADEGLPRRLDPRRFGARSLQRQIPGQAGFQHFFSHAGRAFCLYVVLGDREDAHLQVRRVEQLLAGIEIEPAR
jgi:hypothetical protein